MSKGLENFLPFIESVSAAYPWGDIKDGDGSGNGTDVNRENHADYHQTFRKILDKAYITPNGLPDNVTNGYQYVDALKFLYKNFRGIVPTSVGIILDKFYIRKIIYIDSATTLTGFIMPPSTDLDDTDSITIVNKTNYEVVIQGDGTDTVDLLPSISLLKAGDFAELVLDKGNGNWVLTNYKISTPVTAPAWITPTISANTSIPSTLFSGPSAVPNSFEYRINNQNQLEFRGHLKITTGSSSMDLFELPIGILLSSRFIYALTTSGLLGVRLNNTTGIVSATGSPTTNDLVTLEHLKINLD